MRHTVDRIPSIAWAAKACARETQPETEVLDLNARASRQNKNFHSLVSPWKRSHQWPVHHSPCAGSHRLSHSPQCRPNQEKETQHRLSNPPPPPPPRSSSSSSNSSSNDLTSRKEERLRSPQHILSQLQHSLLPVHRHLQTAKQVQPMRAWDQTLVERSREYRPSTGETLPTSYIIDCEKCGSHSFNDGSVPCPPADGRARLAKLRKMADAGTKHERSRAQIVYQSKKRKLKKSWSKFF